MRVIFDLSVNSKGRGRTFFQLLQLRVLCLGLLQDWYVGGRRLSMLTLASLRQEPILALFGSGQQFVELWTSSELEKQRVGLQSLGCTIIPGNGLPQELVSDLLFAASGQYRALVVLVLRILLR